MKREYDPELVPIAITTSISTQTYRTCKEKGYKWNDVFMTGFSMKQANGDLNERIKQLESQVESFKAFLQANPKKRIQFHRRFD
jgi:hypothetical protein